MEKVNAKRLAEPGVWITCDAKCVVYLALLLIVGGCSHPLSGPYLRPARNSVERARQQMPAIVVSADAAAARVLAGGQLWAGGSQADFMQELVGRAGGLLCIRHLKMDEVRSGDVVLIATRGELTSDDKRLVERTRAAGALVITFAHAGTIDSGPPGALADGRLIPTDTTANIINGWTFVAEFASACTRRGKMPVFYRSYGLPDGRDWFKRYDGQVFHDDLNIAAVPPRVLGDTYLDQVEWMLTRIDDEQPKIAMAGAWLRASGKPGAKLYVWNHLYPHHFADPRAPQPFGSVVHSDSKSPEAASFVLYIGHQYAPAALIEGAGKGKFKLAYSSQQSGGAGENVIWLNPHWTLDDGILRIAGYPLPICPMSGVAQSAVYWAVVAETYGHKP